MPLSIVNLKALEKGEITVAEHCLGDAGQTLGRRSGDVWKMLGRCSGDDQEMLSRFFGDAREI